LSDEKNEVTIITASNELFDLWAEFITAYSNGELIDPDTGKKFKESSVSIMAQGLSYIESSSKGWEPR
jgi:hypothetical protein